jgi:hypothetical protein
VTLAEGFEVIGASVGRKEAHFGGRVWRQGEIVQCRVKVARRHLIGRKRDRCCQMMKNGRLVSKNKLQCSFLNHSIRTCEGMFLGLS